MAVKPLAFLQKIVVIVVQPFLRCRVALEVKMVPILTSNFSKRTKTTSFFGHTLVKKQKRKTKKTPLPMNRNSMIFGGAGLILDWMHIPSNLSIE